MATKIKIGDTVCTLDWEGERWTCEGSEAEDLPPILNEFLEACDPGGADPNPPYTHAQDVAALLGGEVIEFDELPFNPDVVY